MEFNPMLPIYLQVVRAIEDEMLCGTLLGGDKLPSGRDLALRYTINPNTAARVYQELERKGLCYTRRGMGTFVTEDAAHVRRLREERARALKEAYLAGMRAIGIAREEALQWMEENT